MWILEILIDNQSQDIRSEKMPKRLNESPSFEEVSSHSTRSGTFLDITYCEPVTTCVFLRYRTLDAKLAGANRRMPANDASG